MFKIETANFNFVDVTAEPKVLDSIVIHQNIPWQDYLEQVLNNGGQFITARHFEEYTELTVALKVGPAIAARPAPTNYAAPQYAAPAQSSVSQILGYQADEDAALLAHHGSGGPVIKAGDNPDLDALING